MVQAVHGAFAGYTGFTVGLINNRHGTLRNVSISFMTPSVMAIIIECSHSRLYDHLEKSTMIAFDHGFTINFVIIPDRLAAMDAFAA